LLFVFVEMQHTQKHHTVAIRVICGSMISDFFVWCLLYMPQGNNIDKDSTTESSIQNVCFTTLLHCLIFMGLHTCAIIWEMLHPFCKLLCV